MTMNSKSSKSFCQQTKRSSTRRHKTFDWTQQNHQRVTLNLRANATNNTMTSTDSTLLTALRSSRMTVTQHTKTSNNAENNWRRSLPLSIAQWMKKKIEDTISLPTPTYNGYQKWTSPQPSQSLFTRSSLQVRHTRKNTNMKKIQTIHHF